MDSPNKVLRLSGPEHENTLEPTSYDRLSNLPTDILLRILSFLEITEIMQTSLLSKSWRYIWVSVPCLNFDFSEFCKQECFSELSYYACLMKFWFFFKRVIMMRDAPPLYKLHLFSDYIDAYQLELLLYLCFMRKNKKLYLVAGCGDQQCCLDYTLPMHTESISCSIKYLLRLESFARFWNFSTLWNITTLHMVGVRFPNADITEKLFSDCGFLEDLSLECCCFMRIRLLTISGNKLRKLNFVNEGFRWSSMHAFKGELKLHTPNLVSLFYDGPTIRLSGTSDMLFLNSAAVHMRRQVNPKLHFHDLWTMFSGIRHVDELSITAVVIGYYSPEYCTPGCNFPQFSYLRCLKLDLQTRRHHIEGLINLLQLSPNLEALHIHLIQSWMPTFWKSTEVDVRCLSHNLKDIEILVNRDCTLLDLFEITKFFLQNGKSLERIKITLRGKEVPPERFYALNAVPLASESVHLSVASMTASGKKEFSIVYGKTEMNVQTKNGELKIKLRRSLRIAARQPGSSSGRR